MIQTTATAQPWGPFYAAWVAYRHFTRATRTALRGKP